MKQIFILIAIIAYSFSAFAQSGKISGSVTDGQQKTVESASVTLLRAKDSATVKLSAAGKTGAFTFDGIAFGRYLVAVTAVGHQKSFSPVFEISASAEAVQLEPIVVAPQAKSLTGVTVTAKRPLIEQKIDRTVVNVEASVTNVGSTALEVLEKSPGLSVDKDGNISLKGKQGVLVLVDGRPTQLGGADLANLLRNMNANQLDQIEIMTNPPAKYDAAGNAGIINIKTKKNKLAGYNGTVSANYGQGNYPKFNEGINFNYRQGKWNLFTNLSHGYRERNGQLDIKRNFINANTKERTSSFDQAARMFSTNSNFNGKIGADFFASKNTTFGVALSGFSSEGTWTAKNSTDIFSPNGQLSKHTNSLSLQNRSFANRGANFNFRQVLDSTGTELTADVDMVRYKGDARQTLNNYYFDASGRPLEVGDTLYTHFPQVISIYSGRVDYTKPIKGGGRFEAGVKASLVNTDNDARYDTVSNGVVSRDPYRSNHFVYDENINAAYANISGPLSKKWSGQLGLRVENTNAKGNQITTAQKFKRNYTQLFPTAFLQYKGDEKNTWVLNYGRRLQRPNYESLNPFIQFIDRYTYSKGNPDLKPQFSHNIEFSHSYKGYLTTTLNYTRTTDIIQQVLEQNEAKNETFVKQANIAKQRQFGLAISANHPVTKWWTNSFYVNVFNNRFQGLINDTYVSISATTLSLNGTQQFKITKSLSGELGGWFRTAGIEGVFQAKAMGAVNAGFSQTLLKEKATIRLNIRDAFFTQQFRASSKYGNVDVTVRERNDSRVVTIGLTYRFSKGKTGGVKRRAGSANDEQNRVGGGN